MEKPQRRFELNLLVGGDTIDDVTAALDSVIQTITPNMQSACGCPSYGYTAVVTENPGQTREKYMSQVEAYLQWVKDNRENLSTESNG